MANKMLKHINIMGSVFAAGHRLTNTNNMHLPSATVIYIYMLHVWAIKLHVSNEMEVMSQITTENSKSMCVMRICSTTYTHTLHIDAIATYS